MMTKFNKILLFFAIVFANNYVSFAQGETDSVLAAMKIIREAEQTENPRDLIISIAIQRKNFDWDRWVNGSFQLAFPSGSISIKPEDTEIELIYSDLPRLLTDDGTTLDPDRYIFKQQVLPGKLCFSISGPQLYDASIFVEHDSTLKLGTYKITSKTDRVLQNQEIIWVRPSDYYQANAFKLQNDTTILNIPQWYKQNDNIEFSNPLTNRTIVYEKDTTEPDNFLLRSSRAQYIGEQKIKVSWETVREKYTAGFILLRGSKNVFDKNDIDWTNENEIDTVANFLWGEGYEFMAGLGTTRRSKKVYSLVDTNEIDRQQLYCYKILWIDFDGFIYDGDDPFDGLYGRNIACTTIPNAVITYANAYPNPFQRQTLVEYTVEDDVLLTVILYDASGREVDVIINDQPINRGTHSIDLRVNELASNGLYNLLFIAKPKNDVTVELSRASLKLQVTR